MSVWTSPNVRSHVYDRTDYRLCNLFEKLIINSESDIYGDYKYDTTGESTTKIEVYDVSSDALMNKFYELRDKCSEYTNSSSNNYKTPTMASNAYDNLTMFPLILLMNSMHSNSEFTISNASKYKMLPYNDVSDLIYKVDNDQSYTVHEVTSAEDYESILKNMNTIKNKHDADLSQIATSKMKDEITNIEDDYNYKRLLNTFSETEIKQLLMKLTTYNKES